MLWFKIVFAWKFSNKFDFFPFLFAQNIGNETETKKKIKYLKRFKLKSKVTIKIYISNIIQLTIGF